MNIEIGNIYKSDLTKIGRHGIEVGNKRVLIFDDYEILSEIQMLSGNWSMRPFQSACRFVPQSRIFFESVANYISEEPLTEKELEIIKPNLAIRLGRIQNISWGDKRLDSIDKIRGLFMEFGLEYYLDESYSTNKLYIEPYGKSGGKKSAQLIEADNKKYFTCAELLYKSNKIQLQVNSHQSNGIGIFRTGIRSKLPVYYIGEYYDLAGIMKGVD